MQALKDNYFKFISVKLAKKVIIALVFILFFDFFLFSTPVLASEISQNNEISNITDEISNPVQADEQQNMPVSDNLPVIINNLPENNDLNVVSVKHRIVTAYNSEVGQTDDSPCITANGFDLCKYGDEDTVAANFLPFGAKVRIPELFGDKVFIVRDRMNQRFSNRIDVWMVEKQEAKQFGVRLAKIEILE